MPSEALHPLPLRVTYEAPTTDFVISNRGISVKFEPTRRGFAPKTSDPSSRHMRRWIGSKEMILKSFGNTILQQVGVRLIELQGHLISFEPNGPNTKKEEKVPRDTMVRRSKFGGAVGVKPICNRKIKCMDEARKRAESIPKTK